MPYNIFTYHNNNNLMKKYVLSAPGKNARSESVSGI